MNEKIHHLDTHAITGPHQEKRRAAFDILLRKMEDLKSRITQLNRTNPREANKLVDELEEVIIRAEAIMANETLVDQLDKVIETDSGYEIDISRFDQVDDPKDIGGDMAFAAQKDQDCFIVNHLGQKVGGDYNQVQVPKSIGGQVAFGAAIGTEHFVINHLGEKVGGNYRGVDDPFDFKGQLHFLAKKDNGIYLVNQTSEKLIGAFEGFGRPVIAGGEIYFNVQRLATFFIVNGQGDMISGAFGNMRFGISVIGDQIYYAGKDGSGWYVFDQSNHKIGSGYANIRQIYDIAGHPVFTTSRRVRDKTGVNLRVAVVNHEGNKVGKMYDEVADPLAVNGQLNFCARRQTAWYLVNELGEEDIMPYAVSGNPRFIGGRIVYVSVAADGKPFVVLHDGPVFGDKYTEVNSIQEINGQLAVIVRVDNQAFIIDSSGKKASEGFDRIFSLGEKDGIPYCIAEKDKKYILRKLPSLNSTPPKSNPKTA